MMIRRENGTFTLTPEGTELTTIEWMISQDPGLFKRQMEKFIRQRKASKDAEYERKIINDIKALSPADRNRILADIEASQPG